MPNRLSPEARLLASSSDNRFEILAIAVGPWHESKKGPTGKRIYSTEESLRSSVSVFEGLPVAAYSIKNGSDGKPLLDHLPDDILKATEEQGIVFLANRVGRLSGSHFGETPKGKKGIIVKFDSYSEAISHEMKAAIDGNNPDFDGFSIDGNADWTIEKVDGIDYDVPWIKKGRTLDIVKYPAAGGEPIRLAASINLPEGKDMKLTAQQRATIIAVLVAAGVGDEILNNLMAQAPDAFINKGRELLANEREFLKKFDDTLAKFERGEKMELKTEDGSPPQDDKAKADAEAAAKKAADEAAKAKADADAKAKADEEARAKLADDPTVKQANDLLVKANDALQKAETIQGEAVIEKEVTASHLPPITKTQLTERLKASRTYDSQKIKAEIDKEAKYLKAILGDQLVPILRVTGSIQMGQDETDQLILATRGMLKGKNILDANKRPVQAFRSLREMNSRITGARHDEPLDRVFRKLSKLTSGYGFEASDFVDLDTGRITASFLTSDLASVFLVSMHNQYLVDYKEPSDYDAWRMLAKIVSLKDLYTHHYTRSGWYAAAPSVAEGGTYSEITTAPSDEHIGLTGVKYGHIMSITEEMVINDMIGEFQRLQRSLSDGMKRDFYNDVTGVITANTAVAYGSDTNTLVHTNHSNGAASSGTSFAAVDTENLITGWAAMFNQTEFGSSMKLGNSNRPKYLLVHPNYLLKAAALTQGERLVQMAGATAGGFTSGADFLPDAGMKNMLAQFAITPIPLLNTSTTTNWWLLADPNTTPAPAVVVGFLNGVEQPQVVTEPANTGSNFTADKIRIKVKNIRDIEPGDHRGIYGQLA